MSTPNPIETFLDIEPGSTPDLQDMVDAQGTELIHPETGEVVVRPTTGVTAEQIVTEERIDDLKIDKQLNEVHAAAMQAFYQQHALSQQVDPKFSARNSEVAAQFLNIALNTVNSRVDAKHKREKIRIAKTEVKTPNQIQNNVIVADRNSLMQTLFANGGFPMPTVDTEGDKK